MKVLVIDDDPAILRMLALVFAVEGFEVELASSGPQGIVAAISSPPDVIVLDVMMPDVTGWDVAQQLADHPRLRDVPVVFCTALAGAEETWRGWRLGAASYVAKPFDNAHLVAEILRATGSADQQPGHEHARLTASTRRPAGADPGRS